MRPVTLSLGAATALAWLLLTRLAPEDKAVRHPLTPGRTYAVAADGDVARFDLPLSHAGEQYLLVVANLATDTASRRVTVAAEAIDQVELLPLNAVKELSTVRPQAKIIRRPTTARIAARPRRVFQLPVSGSSTRNPAWYRKIVGRLSAEGPSVRVYVDEDDRVAPARVEALLRLCEDRVRPTIWRHLGWPHDVDGDGKLAILVTGWLGRLDGGRVSLGGMVRPADFRTDQKPPYSNRADVLYLNSTFRPDRHLESLLAHELAHAVTLSGRLQANRWWFDAGNEAAWLNEAIAHVTEDLQSDNRSNLDYRIAQFLAEPGRASLVVDDYRSAGLWRDPSVRGACYLFLRWCVEQYGTPLLPNLIYSSRRGIENVETATAAPFEELLRRWAVDLFLDARGAGKSVRRAHNGTALCQLDLSQPIRDWGLAGPRFETLAVAGTGKDDDRELELNVTGTAVRHVLIAADSPGPRRITVRCQEGAAVQLSLVRLPDEMARLELQVARDPEGGWRLRLSEHAGREVQLTHVFWQASGVTNDARPPHGCLRQDELSGFFNAPAVPAGGTLVSRTTALAGPSRGPVTVCVAGTDESGYRVAAWTEIDPTKNDFRLALAANSKSTPN